MKKFTQIHTLTSYPLGNPNRDDQGRPKSGIYGNVPRLRISSQSFRRAVRVSALFADAFDGRIGTRTRRLGDEIIEMLIGKGHDEQKAIEIAIRVCALFGKTEGDLAVENGEGKKSSKSNAKNGNTIAGKLLRTSARTKQMAFISPDERALANELALNLAQGTEIDAREMNSMALRRVDGAVDLALFGRMLAHAPGYNREAALQVGHLITTHRAVVEDDYFTAVEELNGIGNDANTGSGFLDEQGFGSGVFYGYFCIDMSQLIENLDGDAEIAARTAEILTEAVATVTPSGKKSAYAHQTLASFVMVETGNRQPRNLVEAFLKPITGQNLMADSISALRRHVDLQDRFYGRMADERAVLDMSDPDSAGIEVLKNLARSSALNG
ncbi:type I-E CRISPR-associated protein Cas7/Cse4/CasC [Paracoccus litorisediminis]|uniref:type I-E CRISPR-associated protein Cas7/Cse4/CasC n=1 Tax=Paracoccus litorisediminis TaxID=2006130 RepID=UPI00372DB170